MIEPLVQRAIVLHAVLVVVLVLVGNHYGVDQAYLTEHHAWVPILVVNAGILVGNLAIALLGLSDESTAVVAQGRMEDLEHGRAVVVEQLRALEAERDKLTPEDYATERARLVMVGAGALREMESGEAHAPTPTPASAAAPAPTAVQAAELLRLRDTDPAAFEAALARIAAAQARPAGISGEWRGAAYTLAAVGLCLLLVNYASNDAKDRGAGGSMTGGDSVAPMGGGGMPPGMGQGGGGMPPGMGGGGGAEDPGAAEPPDPRIAELEAKVTANPKDVASLDDLTELYLAGRDLNGAMRSNSRALEADANDIDATVFRAVLRAFIGRRDQAVTDLNAVLVAHPDQLRAQVYMGLLSMQTDPAKAVEMLEKATKQDSSPELQGALKEARRRLAGGPEPEQPPMGGGAPMGGGGAPMGGGGGQLLASGTIELGNPSESGQVLFVSVQGSQPGPPLAALKLPPGPFPMKFEITTANIIPMMAGRPLPPTFSVVARLDSDGDPMSRPPTDPSARQDGLSAGTENLVLKLP